MLFFQAQVDMQHLWFGRRAATRIRSELMTAIYDKALKRKDLSGIVSPQDKDKDKAKKKAADGKPKAGADIGKIVNLMAGDANRVSNVHLLLRQWAQSFSQVAMTTTALHMVYGAPFGKAFSTSPLHYMF